MAMPADSCCERKVWKCVWNCGCKTGKSAGEKLLDSWTGLNLFQRRFVAFLIVSLLVLDFNTLGACAMTTSFLDNQICTFKIVLSWRFPRKKQRFGTIFLSAPKAHPPQKRKFCFYCRLAVSETFRGNLVLQRCHPNSLVSFWTVARFFALSSCVSVNTLLPTWPADSWCFFYLARFFCVTDVSVIGQWIPDNECV